MNWTFVFYLQYGVQLCREFRVFFYSENVSLDSLRQAGGPLRKP